MNDTEKGSTMYKKEIQNNPACTGIFQLICPPIIVSQFHVYLTDQTEKMFYSS